MFALNKVFSAATILGITISTVLAAKPIEAVPSPTASSGTYVKVNLTGSDKNPTPIGKFKINGNRQYTPGGNNITLTGSYGTAKVGIWNPFVGNSIAFHNAPWRKEYEFGNTERRKKNGSHGCINMRYSDALYLYKNTKSGTPVYVSK
jgi:lipoprotein-anchoring transpeptidase ErfK/SrfK